MQTSMKWLSAVALAVAFYVAPAHAQCVNANSSTGLAIQAVNQAMTDAQAAAIATAYAASSLQLSAINAAIPKNITANLSTLNSIATNTLPGIPTAVSTDIGTVNVALLNVISRLAAIQQALQSGGSFEPVPTVQSVLTQVGPLVSSLPPLCQ
jgi:hypothetical protein